MSGIDFDYNNEAKNVWRSKQWREIKKRLTVRPSHALCLYLAARTDLDSIEAIRQGFINENLIAVDTDLDVVKELRSRGRLAIQGDISEILTAWPGEYPIHVVVADFCGGLTDRTWSAFGGSTAMVGAVREAVLAVNLLRGRDKSTARDTAAIAESMVCAEISKKSTSSGISLRNYNPKHRGSQFYWCNYANVMGALRVAGLEDRWKTNIVARWRIKNNDAGDEIQTYRSGPQVFDSIVMRNLAGYLDYVNVTRADREGLIAANIEDMPTLLQTKHRVAATLAHRTRRMSERFAK
jgi:hypothetical protein